MELSSYLKYKGFQVVGQDATEQGSGPLLLIEGSEHFPGDRCVGYNEYTCVHAESAKPGALIIVLPDDYASMSDVQNIGKDSKLLFSVGPPAICCKNNSWFRSLYAISPLFSVSGLPEHWLRLDVFQNPG